MWLLFFFFCICVKHEGSTAISMSVILASREGNSTPPIRFLILFLFWCSHSCVSSFTPCLYPFTKLSTDTMMSSAIESVFVFGFPLRHQEEVIACFCGQGKQLMMCLDIFLFNPHSKSLTPFHSRATRLNSSPSNHVCRVFQHHAVAWTGPEIQVDPEVITGVNQIQAYKFWAML